MLKLSKTAFTLIIGMKSIYYCHNQGLSTLQNAEILNYANYSSNKQHRRKITNITLVFLQVGAFCDIFSP